jgi:hypothetical protein
MTERRIPCKAKVTSVYLDRLPELPFGHDPLADPSTVRPSRSLKHLADKHLIEMLRSRNGENVYAALAEIGRRRCKSALRKLRDVALYEEYKGIQAVTA